jgi:hypothetical protein
MAAATANQLGHLRPQSVKVGERVAALAFLPGTAIAP